MSSLSILEEVFYSDSTCLQESDLPLSPSLSVGFADSDDDFEESDTLSFEFKKLESESELRRFKF